MDRTDILLVASRQADSGKIISMATGVTQPLGLAYIASYLKKNGFKPQILDNELEKLGIDAFKLRIRDLKPLCVGFSALTNTVNNALSFAAAVKEVDPGIKVIFGGVHASALPSVVLSSDSVDIVVRGEGEQAVCDILEALSGRGDLGGVKGIVYKRGAELVEGPARERLSDIESLPFPAYELLQMDKYFLPAGRRVTDKKIGPVISGRGCPFHCAFCSHNRATFGSSVRLRSAESVVKEIKHLKDAYGIGEFIFWDDCFTIDKERVKQICRLIVESRLDISWSCSSRVDSLDQELCGRMYEAGCRSILLGVESGSQKIIDSLKKGITLDKAASAIALCRKNRISSVCTFIIGSPEETKESISETMGFVRKTKPDIVQYCLFVPFPGSEIFDKAVAEGRIDPASGDWDAYQSFLSALPMPVNLTSLTQGELVYYLKKALREFYLNPFYIIKKLLNARSVEGLRQLFRGFCAVLVHQLRGESQSSCPVCKAAASPVLKIKGARIFRCPECGLKFRGAGESGLFNRCKECEKKCALRGFDPSLHQRRSQSEKLRLGRIVSLTGSSLSKMKVLEIGTGSGCLASLLVKECLRYTGTEPYGDFYLRSTQDYPMLKDSIIRCELPDSSCKGSFDLEILVDGLQFIKEPLDFLRRARALMKENGVFYIEVPNERYMRFRCLIRSILGLYPCSGIHPGHRNFFDKRSLSELAARAGFEIKAYRQASIISDSARVSLTLRKNPGFFIGIIGSFARATKLDLLFQQGNICLVLKKTNL